MNEEIEKLINKSLEPLQETIKNLKSEGESKDTTIKALEDKIKELEKEPTIKAGAALSGANASKLRDCCEKIASCCKELNDFVESCCSGKDGGEEGKGLEPTAEELTEIAKAAAEKVAEIVKDLELNK